MTDGLADINGFLLDVFVRLEASVFNDGGLFEEGPLGGVFESRVVDDGVYVVDHYIRKCS